MSKTTDTAIKHTPGPWYVKKEHDQKYGDLTELKIMSPVAGRTLVCDLTEAMSLLNIDETFEANANLIAAALDMLEALKDCKDYLGWKYPKEADILGRINAIILKTEI